jgi:NAD+ synthase
MRELNYQKVEEKIVEFIKNKFEESGFTKAVLGMSGGLDSSIVATLTCKAIGKENVMGIMMPYNKIKESIENDVDDAKKICEHLGMKSIVIDITSASDHIGMSICNKNKEIFGVGNIILDSEKLRLGNVMARVRALTLFDFSSANQALVMATTNFTESSECFSFFTIGGDDQGIFEPIMYLYKTEVFELAKYLGLPQFIIDKKPSARLYAGHEDEIELDINYNDADPILYYIHEEKWEREHFEKMGFDMKVVDKVIALMKKGSFKNEIPYCPSKELIKECIL